MYLHLLQLYCTSEIDFRMSESDMKGFFAAIIIGIIIAVIFVLAVKSSINNKDMDKPLITEHGRIVEKTLSQVDMEWYIVELDNHQRVKMRNPHPNSVLLSVGDYGEIGYKGNTICSFRIEK